MYIEKKIRGENSGEKNLVIVESPAKAKTIEKYWGIIFMLQLPLDM